MTTSDQENGTAQRLSSPVKARDEETILDIDNYAPFLLNAVSSAWQRRTSAINSAPKGYTIYAFKIQRRIRPQHFKMENL